MKKVRRLFRLRNVVRSRNDPECMPLNPTRDRSPSIDSVSTSSSSGSASGKRNNRSYGSILPTYFSYFRNSLRRSHSSQVRRQSVIEWQWSTHARRAIEPTQLTTISFQLYMYISLFSYARSVYRLFYTNAFSHLRIRFGFHINE